MTGKRTVSVLLVLCVCAGLMVFPAATVTKLPGNTNILTISVTDVNGSYEKDFYIGNYDNNLYYVEGCLVYVSTFGNNKVDQCYIVKSIYDEIIAEKVLGENMPIVPYEIFNSYIYKFDRLWNQNILVKERGVVHTVKNESYTDTITARFSTTQTRYQEVDVTFTSAYPHVDAFTQGQSESFIISIEAPLPPRHQIAFSMEDLCTEKRFSYIQHHYVLGIHMDSILYMDIGLDYDGVVLTAGNPTPL